MKVMLIADPPAGDKAEKKLQEIEGVEVHYVRGRSPSAALPIPAGARFVLGMNTGRAGAALKEQARKAGAMYISIPPGWSETSILLKQVGFYAEARRAAEQARAVPLTHNPFAELASKLEEVKPAATETVAVAQAQPVPPLPFGAATTREARAIIQPAADAAIKMLEDGRYRERSARAAWTKYRDQQKVAGLYALSESAFLKHWKRVRNKKGLPSSDTDIRISWARDFLRGLDKLPPQRQLIGKVREKFGIGVNEYAASRLLKAETRRRASATGQQLSPTAQAIMDGSGHRSVTTTPGAIPPAVDAAQKKLVEALRASAVSVYSLTYAGGDAESSFEFTAKGTTKL